MSDLVHEQCLQCPHCGEDISVLLDISAGGQTYIEDCEVCCAPMAISFEVDEGEVSSFVAEMA